MKSPVKRHGGKGGSRGLANWIRSLMPERDGSWNRYVEPYFGGGSVMFALDPEGVAEYANDLDRELMNFWHCLKIERLRRELIGILNFTPLSCESFEDSLLVGDSDRRVVRAASFFIRNRQSRQGLGKDYVTPTSRTRRGMNEQVSAWLSAVDGLPEFVERLRRVEVWNRPALEVIEKLDSPQTVFYLDPPYLHETRSSTGEYEHEMSAFDHVCLLALLSDMKRPWGYHRMGESWTDEQHGRIAELCYQKFEGRFLLSGYRSQLYDMVASLQGWHRHEFETPNCASSKATKDIKTECVWTNYQQPRG